MERGQFFSADFLIAFVTVTFGIGVLLHSSQLAMAGFGQYGKYENNVAEVVAAAIAQDPATNLTQFLPQVSAYFPLTCWRFDNGTDTCTNAILNQCSGERRNTFTARRFAPCTGGTNGLCLVTVLSCDKISSGG